MSSEQSASGVDLARVALRAAREASKNKPIGGKPNRRRSSKRTDGREPAGFATVLEQLAAERAWDLPAAAGNLADRWATIAPELAGHVQPAGFDADSGRLELRPASPAYATQVRLHQADLIRRINTALGTPVVQTLRVLPPGTPDRTTHLPNPTTSPAPTPPQPARTRKAPSAGYQRTLAAHKAVWSGRAIDPEVQAKIDRQNESPRMREPEAAFGDGQAALESLREKTRAVDTTHARALRRLAAERAGLPETRVRLERSA